MRLQQERINRFNRFRISCNCKSINCFFNKKTVLLTNRADTVVHQPKSYHTSHLCTAVPTSTFGTCQVLFVVFKTKCGFVHFSLILLQAAHQRLILFQAECCDTEQFFKRYALIFPLLPCSWRVKKYFEGAGIELGSSFSACSHSNN